MTAQKLTYLECDIEGCGNASGAIDGRPATAGWEAHRFKLPLGMRHVCPSCAKKFPRPVQRWMIAKETMEAAVSEAATA